MFPTAGLLGDHAHDLIWGLIINPTKLKDRAELEGNN